MGFDEKKKATLHKMLNNDKSKKGSVDDRMKKIVENINNSKDYYTTSSCSGRITLLNKLGDKKNMNEWLIASHENITFEDYKNAMNKEGEKGDVWFMQESPIMHICARDEEKAHDFMEVCKEAGFKRATIISVKPRIIIELLGSEKMETIVYRNETDFTTDEYKEVLVKEANKKMNLSHAKLKRLETLSEKL